MGQVMQQRIMRVAGGHSVMGAGHLCLCIYLMKGGCNGRGTEVFVERDARQQIAAVAESLSAVEA